MLNRLAATSLGPHFRVVGTHALYAYESAHSIRLSDDEEDFWVAQAPHAQELLDAPQFSAVIVATNGDMARMTTLEPMAFVRFKRWMSTLPQRDPLKRRRDALPAEAVEEVVQEYLPQWAQD